MSLPSSWRWPAIAHRAALLIAILGACACSGSPEELALVPTADASTHDVLEETSGDSAAPPPDALAAVDAPQDAPLEAYPFDEAAVDAWQSDAPQESGGDSGADAPDDPPPVAPNLIRYVTGSEADAKVAPQGPGLILMGGGTDVDAAFTWWKPLIAGGDVVVLRTSGGDGYNSYLYQGIGGCDSVETLLVTTTELANDPYVAWALSHAEGIFLAGGDQAEYLEAWKGTAVEAALQQAWSRGAVIGGTSAGCAILGEFSFGAYSGTIYSDEALEDPYSKYMTMEGDFLAFPHLSHVITDTHFSARDRMGRLVAFLARIEQDGWADPVLGIGIDEATALMVGPDGSGKVAGSGKVYLIESYGEPDQCAPGQPLTYTGLSLHRLIDGDTVQLPSGATSVAAIPLSVSAGSLSPADPY